MPTYLTESATVSAARRALEWLAALPERIRSARSAFEARVAELTEQLAADRITESYRTQLLDQARARQAESVASLRASRDSEAGVYAAQQDIGP